MQKLYRDIRQRRKFKDVDHIQTSVTIRTEGGGGGTWNVSVKCSNNEYRSGRYRNLVLAAVQFEAKCHAARAITYRTFGEVWVCLDGKWHTQDPSKWAHNDI